MLNSLPPDVALALQSRLEPVNLAAGAILYEAGTDMRHVYFPVTAVVSLVSSLKNGASAEVAVVGREGLVGMSAFLGDGTALSSGMVQRAGSAWRMSARDISPLAREFEPLMHHLLRYAQVLLMQMAQTSACHQHHALAPQLCRWLLQHLDRQATTDLAMTHERIAGLLGVRREGVTEAALMLQREGVIRYRRGHIHVLDRSALEQRSCECYATLSHASARLSKSAPATARSEQLLAA